MPAHITTPDDIQLHEWAGTQQCAKCKRPLRAEPHDAEMHQSCRMPVPPEIINPISPRREKHE